MKKVTLALFAGLLLLCGKTSYAQWTLSGANVYNNPISTNVGIGTSTPTRRLDVVGSIGLTSQFIQNTFLGKNFVSNAEFGGMILQSPLIDNVLIEQNALYDGVNSENSRYANNGPASTMQMSKGNIYFYTGASGTAGTTIPNWAFQPKFGITNNGGVGIGSTYAASNTNGQGVLTVQSSIGLGTQTPSAQLHTTGTVRFQGLVSGGTPNNIVSIDANGQLWRYALPGNVVNSCASINFMPKTTSGGNLTCSQIFDNGTNVGIGTSTGFGYVSGATLSQGNPTPPTSFRLSVNGWVSATAFVALSDKKFKKDIHNLENSLNKLSRIQGVSYLWNNTRINGIELTSDKQIGFIAQEIEKVIPEAVVKNSDGVYGVNYNMIVPVAVEAIKELKNQIDRLEKEIEDLKSHIAAKSSGTVEEKPVLGSDKLFQNTPNPFSGETVVEFYLNNASAAFIVINSLEGKPVRNIPLTGQGKGTIRIRSGELKPGTYTYSLVVNSRWIDSKLMIVSN